MKGSFGSPFTSYFVFTQSKEASEITSPAAARQRRQSLGLSQRELSEPGVSYGYISRIEAGARTPSMKALRKLAPKLGVSVEWLETGKQSPAEQLTRLVLEHDGQPLPEQARRLAR